MQSAGLLAVSCIGLCRVSGSSGEGSASELMTDPVPYECMTEVPISGLEASQGHSLLLEVALFLLAQGHTPGLGGA